MLMGANGSTLPAAGPFMTLPLAKEFLCAMHVLRFPVAGLSGFFSQNFPSLLSFLGSSFCGIETPGGGSVQPHCWRPDADGSPPAPLTCNDTEQTWALATVMFIGLHSLTWVVLFVDEQPVHVIKTFFICSNF